MALLSSGCKSPSAANIELRKTLQKRDDEVAMLKRQHTADEASLNAGRSSTTAALSTTQLSQLFTVHGIKLGRLTAIRDNALRVSVVPTDDQGQPIKAAGSLTVEAFDLASGGKSIGKWDFNVAKTRAAWFGDALRYEYIVHCPLPEATPKSITIRVAFRDLLTGREFAEQREVTR